MNEPLNLCTFPPAIIVFGPRDAQLALAAARPVTLLSSSGAALSWGCLWWRALLKAAGYNGPSLLDCAAAPGRAAEALAIGLPGVILAPCPAWGEIAAFATQCRATLLAAPPPALDLHLPGAEKRLNTWLGG